MSRRTILIGLAMLVLGWACSPQIEERERAKPANSPGAGGGELRLIAHRGGVVGDAYAENSPAALEAAVERGYWMVAVDIRESADGRLVVHHDEDFQRFYGDERRVADLTWDKIEKLRAIPGDSRPLTFAELAELAGGRLRLMLDVKPPHHSDAFFETLEDVLSSHGLLENAYIIGTPQARKRFLGKARVGVPLDALREATARGENVAERYFLFMHGRDLDAEAVRYAQSLDVPVVPSINIFHYNDLPDDQAAAEADIRRMLDLGVTEFQIDSPYDVYLR